MISWLLNFCKRGFSMLSLLILEDRYWGRLTYEIRKRTLSNQLHMRNHQDKGFTKRIMPENHNPFTFFSIFVLTSHVLCNLASTKTLWVKLDTLLRLGDISKLVRAMYYWGRQNLVLMGSNVSVCEAKYTNFIYCWMWPWENHSVWWDINMKVCWEFLCLIAYLFIVFCVTLLDTNKRICIQYT